MICASNKKSKMALKYDDGSKIMCLNHIASPVKQLNNPFSQSKKKTLRRTKAPNNRWSLENTRAPIQKRPKVDHVV